jgi:hypothetical protein
MMLSHSQGRRRRTNRSVGFDTLESRRLLSGNSLTLVAPSDPFAGSTADNVPLQEQLYGSTL